MSNLTIDKVAQIIYDDGCLPPSRTEAECISDSRGIVNAIKAYPVNRIGIVREIQRQLGNLQMDTSEDSAKKVMILLERAILHSDQNSG